jgi:hypothetical protein
LLQKGIILAMAKESDARAHFFQKRLEFITQNTENLLLDIMDNCPIYNYVGYSLFEVKRGVLQLKAFFHVFPEAKSNFLLRAPLLIRKPSSKTAIDYYRLIQETSLPFSAQTFEANKYNLSDTKLTEEEYKRLQFLNPTLPLAFVTFCQTTHTLKPQDALLMFHRSLIPPSHALDLVQQKAKDCLHRLC